MPELTRAEEIQREMAEVRCDVGEEVRGIMDNARVMTDWKHYVRRYPWAAAGAAAAVGFLAVPKRVEIVSPSAKELSKLAKQNKLVVQHKPDPEARGSISGPIFTMLASMLVRGLIAYAGQQAGKFFGHEAAEERQPPDPQKYPFAKMAGKPRPK